MPNTSYPAFRLLWVCLLLTALLWLGGCSPRHPLGIPDEEWQAHEQQAELDRAAAEQRAAEARAREAEEQRRIMDLAVRRSEAHYGERVQCIFSPAEAWLGREWRSIEPLALDLVSGLVVPYRIESLSGGRVRYQADLYAGFDGQTVSLCRHEPSARQPAGASCARLLGTFEEYRRGLRETIQSGDFVRGQLRCHLGPGEGMPLRMR